MSLWISGGTVETNSTMLGVVFFLSSCVAVLGFALPGAPGENFQTFGYTVGDWPSTSLGIIWLLLFAFALVKFGRRGLWLLVGAPFALVYRVVNFFQLS